MTISVTLDPNSTTRASVRVRHRWWEKLLGREDHDYHVEAVPCINGRIAWYVDAINTIRCSRDVVEAIEAEMRRVAA